MKRNTIWNPTMTKVVLLVSFVTAILLLNWAHSTTLQSAFAQGTAENPWQAIAPVGSANLNRNYRYAMGYHFVPQEDGTITELGGLFKGTKTVRLFNKQSGALLAETTVTANNDWSYAPISPVSVEMGVEYTVAVYLAGSGGVYLRNISFPMTSGSIEILATTFTRASGNSDARPTNSRTTRMYGWADVTFESATVDGQYGPLDSNYSDGGNLDYNYGINSQGNVCDASNEYSGITYDKTRRNRLMVVDDNDLMIQVQVTGDDDQLRFWGIDRVIDINIAVPNDNKFDAEGIAWMYDNTYALLSEEVGYIFIVDVPEGVTQIDNSHVVHSIDTGIREINGSGAEGIAFDYSSAASATEQANAVFYVLDEKPASVYKVTWDGTVSAPLAIPNIVDASGIYAKVGTDQNNYLFIVSHESQKVVEAVVDSDFTQLSVLSTLDVSSQFNQPEGIVFNRTMDEMIIIAEDDGSAPACFARFD